MAKRFKSGLVVGKFMPPHMGHVYLINSALANCEKVYVLACYTDTEPIDGASRFKALKRIFWMTNNLEIISVDTSHLPQYESDCDTLDEFYEPWIELIADLAPDIDSVFTSEAYGDDFARYLNVEHFMVDQERTKYPISGTEVRKDPFSNFDMLPPATKRYYQKNVAILGTESTGKTTLTGKLERHFNSIGISTGSMREYGRDYVDTKTTGGWTVEEFEKIAVTHNNLFRTGSLVGVNKLMISDTEAVVTKAFADLYMGENIESKVIDHIIKNQVFDKYILLDIDVPWVDDGTREFPHKREEHLNLIKKNLDHYGIDYEVVSGDYNERFEKSLKIIEEMLA